MKLIAKYDNSSLKRYSVNRFTKIVTLIFSIGMLFVSFVAISGVSNKALGASSTSLKVSLVATSNDKLSLTYTNLEAQNGETINFYVQENEFSSKGFMQIGTGTVIGGNATTTYNPTWTGYEVFAAAPTNSTLTSSGATQTTFDVKKDPSGFSPSLYNYARPLGGVGHYLVSVLLGLVAIIWILLLGIVVVMFIRIPKLKEN